MALKYNVMANYAGQGWKALMGFVFIPLYLRYLGPEAFALIGIHALLYAWLGLLDMGLKPALAREMARFTAGTYPVQFVRDLLASVLVFGLALAAAIVMGVFAASRWLAEDWLRASALPTGTLVQALQIMGFVLAARFIETIYTNCLVGLQRQVLQNALGILIATLRGLGAVAILTWVSPTINAFFLWQGAVSLLSLALLSVAAYRALPAAPRRAQFSWTMLSHIRKFAGGIFAISALGLVLTQLDKVVLSRWLTLDAFGYYTLAAMVAAALRLIPSPIVNAVYPQLTRLAAVEADAEKLRDLYHLSSQLVSVLMGSAALVLIAFARPILWAWTGDETLAAQVAPLLSLLALGTLLNGLVWIPYQLQLAHGWISLALRSNLAAVIVMVPLMLLLVSKFGAVGAAWAWIVLNVGYLTISVHLVHRRLLVGEARRWYLADVAAPLSAAAAVIVVAHALVPSDLARVAQCAAIALVAGLTLAAAVLAAPRVRSAVLAPLRREQRPSA